MEMRWCAQTGVPHSRLLTWEPADRAKLLAHLLEEASRCSSCGTAAWEWEDDRFAYSATAVVCQGCFHLEAAAEDATDAPPGARMVLVPKGHTARTE